MSALGGELGERWGVEWSACAGRRANAARRLQIYNEAHLPLVHATIAARCADAPTAKYVKRFAQRAPNLTRAVVDTVACAYTRGAARELRGANQAAARAFADIVRESGIARKAGALNARAWLAPVLVSPHLDRRGLLAFDFLGSDKYTAHLDGDHVEAALWQQGDKFIEITPTAWNYYSAAGEFLTSVPHACGEAPGVHVTAVDNSADPWIETLHEGLTDATLDVAYLVAWNRYVRQVSSVAMVVLTAEPDTLKEAAGQAIGHPGQPFVVPARPGEADARVLNRMVPAAEGLAEIAAAINMATTSEGLPVGLISLGNIGSNGLVIAADDDRLALLRDKQVPWLHAAESRLWPLVCDLIRGSGHKHAKALPSGDEVRDMLALTFPDLASPAAMLKRIEAMKAGLPFGITSPTDDMMAARPELTRADVTEIRHGNLADYIEHIDPLVTRNVPAEAPTAHGAQTLAQEQGRAGGESSGRTRAAQAQENQP